MVINCGISVRERYKSPKSGVVSPLPPPVPRRLTAHTRVQVQHSDQSNAFDQAKWVTHYCTFVFASFFLRSYNICIPNKYIYSFNTFYFFYFSLTITSYIPLFYYFSRISFYLTLVVYTPWSVHVTFFLFLSTCFILLCILFF